MITSQLKCGDGTKHDKNAFFIRPKKPLHTLILWRYKKFLFFSVTNHYLERPTINKTRNYEKFGTYYWS